MTSTVLADHLWTYRARAVRVIDGDTIDVEIDQGLHTYRVERLRLLGVNTPELHSPVAEVRTAAQDAKALTVQWLSDHLHGLTAPNEWPLLIRTEKADAFCRYLADVYCTQEHSLTQALLDAGYLPYERKKD